MKFKEIKLSSIGRKTAKEDKTTARADCSAALFTDVTGCIATDSGASQRQLQLRLYSSRKSGALKLYVAARSGLSPVPESGDGVNGGEGAMCSDLVFDRPYDAGEAKEGA